MTTEDKQEKAEGADEAPAAKSSAAKRAKPRRKAQAIAKSTASAKGPKRVSSRSTAKKEETTQGTSRRGTREQRTAQEEPQEGGGDTPKLVAKPLPRLLARFRDEISQELVKEFSYATPMQVPRLTKVVLNIGLAEAIQNAKVLETATSDLSLITGQRPVVTRARKSIAGFKLREGMPIGLAVTLRGRRMYEFVDRLISSALPRIRDFRGLSREAFDGRGNYTLGISEQVIFPEIDYNSIDRIRGLQVVVVTTARTDREGLRLLELLGVPMIRPEADPMAA